MSSETRWITVLSAIILVIGIFLGIALDRFLFRPPPPPPLPPIASGGGRASLGRMALDRLTRNLNLRADQQKEMREIFDRYVPELRHARLAGGDLLAIQKKMREEIRKVLTSEQFTKFEETYRRREERWRGMQSGGATAPPPPAPAPAAPPTPPAQR